MEISWANHVYLGPLSLATKGMPTNSIRYSLSFTLQGKEAGRQLEDKAKQVSEANEKLQNQESVLKTEREAKVRLAHDLQPGTLYG